VQNDVELAAVRNAFAIAATNSEPEVSVMLSSYDHATTKILSDKADVGTNSSKTVAQGDQKVATASEKGKALKI